MASHAAIRAVNLSRHILGKIVDCSRAFLLVSQVDLDQQRRLFACPTPPRTSQVTLEDARNANEAARPRHNPKPGLFFPLSGAIGKRLKLFFPLFYWNRHALRALAELTSCNLDQLGPNTSPSLRLAGIFKLRLDIMATGKVARFFDQKGFGFIQPEGGGKDLFVHINEVEGGQLQEGDTVEYEATEGPKGPQASSVKVV